MTGNGSQRARFGPFEADLHTRELWKFGTRLRLVGQPFAILAVLLARPGELVTREELRNRLWRSDTFVDFDHGLNAAMNKLREALSDSAASPRYIETLPRRGYRFMATVEWVDLLADEQTPNPVGSSVPGDISGTRWPGTFKERAQDGRGVERPPKELRSVSSLLAARIRGLCAFKEHAQDGRGVELPAPRPGIRVFGALLKPVPLAALVVVGLSSSVFWVAARYHETRMQPAAEHRTRPLTNVLGLFEPRFSPDGNAVAFVHGGEPADEGIVVSSIGNGQMVQLTRSANDCCPAWSPDGRWIAFARSVDQQYSIYVVAADGAADQKRIDEKAWNLTSMVFAARRAERHERKLNTHGVTIRRGALDWSPDGKSIVFAGAGGIYLLSLEDSTVHRLTESPPLAEDWGPSFSPDGEKVLFVRNGQIGQQNEIWEAFVASKAVDRILSEPGLVVSAPRWSFDGRSVIFAADRGGHPALWRAVLGSGEPPIQINEAGSPAWDPALSRRGYRFAYERLIRNLNIWQIDLSASSDRTPHVLISGTSDTDQGPAPQFSPDGQKVAYMSDRSGTMEIWVSQRDGSHPFQLTAVGTAGTPRWSPDSQTIVFDSDSLTGGKIVRIDLGGGVPKVLTPQAFSGVCPNWSHDGKWIYFAHEANGHYDVWKVSSAGGKPVQITRRGGHAAWESPDGKTIYYAKTSLAEPEIWQVAVDGGTETLVPEVRPGTWASWQVVEDGIVFVGPSLGHHAVLSVFDFATQRASTVAVLDRVPFWLGATTDGRTVAFDQPGQEQAQAMLIENFQ